MKKIRILSLDGGGIRGIIPATIIAYIEKKLIDLTNNPNTRIADFFDIIVGTSTGGILSCLYLTPNPEQNNEGPSSKYTAEQAVDFYAEKGYQIFNASKKFTFGGLRFLFNATAYNAKNLEHIFEEEFGELKMSDLLKPCLIPTYDMQQKSAFFFSSEEPTRKRREFYVKDVARSTSAAPTYFTPSHIKNLVTHQYMTNIDGGVFANNPTMCAYSECRKSVFPQIAYPAASDMLILSIGTGGGQFSLPSVKKSHKWNVINWAKSIPNIMMDGSIDTVDYHMKQLFEALGEEHQLNYKRIDVPLSERTYAKNMADASPKNIAALKRAGEATLQHAIESRNNEHNLNQFIELLVENSFELAGVSI